MKQKQEDYFISQQASINLFIVIINYSKNLREIETYLPEHKAFLDQQYLQGYFIISGKQVPFEGGIIIAHEKSKAALWQRLQADPFIQYDVATYQIIEFTPTRYLSLFESILSQN